MDFGIAMFLGSRVLPPDLARAVEERGFESLFYPEHTHIPISSKRPDGSSPRSYADAFDPFIALAAAAAVTTTIKLGTGVSLVPERDPIVTAKEIASLDLISGGRFLFGVGAGWNREELANHGVAFSDRMAVLADRVRAMRVIWAQEEAEYHGPHVDFDPLWSWPKPTQRPGPPILVGGNGPGTEDRVLAFGDEWFPQAGPLKDVAELRDRIARLRERGVQAGKPDIPVTLFGVPPRAELIAEIAAAGVNRVLFPISPLPEPDQAMRELDEYAAFVAALTG